MSPAPRFPSHPPSAKRRKAGYKGDGKATDLLSIADTTLQSDILATPPVATPLTSLLSDLPTPPPDEKLTEIKNAIQGIKQKKIEFDSAILRNTLRKTCKGQDISTLFRSRVVESLSCVPPTRIEIVGSFSLGWCGNTVDIAVEMPEDLFEVKDYQNYRYHDKRLFYLVFIARHLLKLGKWGEMSMLKEPLAGDELLPVLSVSLKDTRHVFRILPFVKSDMFERKKLRDNRKNVLEKGESSLVPGTGTVRYNQSVLLDMSMISTLHQLVQMKNQTPAFADSVQLLHAWSIRQRLVPKFIFSVLIRHIITTKIAPARATREHLLRSALNAIRNGVLSELEISGVQVCYNIDDALLERTKMCARIALGVIESKTAGIEPWYGIVPYLFANPRGKGVSARPLCCIFDAFIKVEGVVKSRVLSVLETALVQTGRVERVEHLGNGLFGLLITSYENTIRKVDTCPKEVDSKEFKAFWGAKSTLRRFKDGKIAESVVWDGGVDTLSEIATYALKEHISKEVSITVVVGEIEKAARWSPYDTESSKAIAAFNELATLLRSLEGLPLSIRGLHATAAHLRRCGPFPIHPVQRNRYVTPLDIIASFETSGAWPDDAVAISAAKAAFYVAVKGKLAGHGISSWATISWIDIELGGVIFRLRIKVEREAMLLEGKEEGERLEWMTSSLVRHHDYIRNVKHGLMGMVARLVKRWLNSHMMLTALGERGDQLVETIVAYTLSGVDARRSVQGAFCEVLYVLAEYPWEVYPMVMWFDTSDEDGMDDGERQMEKYEMMVSAQKLYAGGRKGLGVYSEVDGNGDAVSWFEGRYAVEKVIAGRIRETARASLMFVEKFLADGKGSFESIMTASTDVFNAVIRMDVSKFSGLKARGRSGEVMLPGFDPIERVVGELRRRLGQYGLFAWSWGSTVVYVVWKPVVYKQVEFRIKECAFRTLVEDTDKSSFLQINVPEVIAEMRRIGGDVIVSVDQL